MATSGVWELGDGRDLDATRRAVERAESRARLQVKASTSKASSSSSSSSSRGNARQYAQALHRQADELRQRGEHESALVLYHRAATVCPHDSSHSVAARRTAAAISSWSNPEKSSTRQSARSGAISRVTSCPESAVLKASHDASKSTVDPSIMSDISRYLDTRKRSSNDTIPTLGSPISQVKRSRATLKYVNGHADAMLKKLKSNFDAGNMRTSLSLAEDLLALSPDLGDPRRHKIPAYHYLSLIHAALGRHDRASEYVARLVRLALSINDVVHLSQALVTLGKVHLSFGCLQAAARAWQNVSVHVEHPVPRAWLHHEIGRCHLERGKYVEALREAARCRERAEEASSSKWTFHASLLRAQCLAMLGRFAEALEELRVTAKISEEEGDTSTLSYIQDLIEQLNRALREVTFGTDRCSKDAARGLSPRQEPGRSEGNEAITTFGIKKTTCSRDDASAPSLYCDYVEDETPDRHETDEASTSLDSATTFKSKRTNLTYVIESCTSLTNGTKTHSDQTLTESSSHDSRMTFGTCDGDSKHSAGAEETPASPVCQRPIEACSSYVETSGREAERETYRISRSCESERCSSDTGKARRNDDDTASARGCSLLTKTREQDDDEGSFVREGFSD